MPDKLAILIAGPAVDRPENVVTPLVHALAARALDAEVELHFAGPAVRWVLGGIADSAWPTPARERSIGDFLREAQAADVALLACSMACAAWQKPDEPLLPGVRQAGATAFVARALDPDWATLVF